MEYQGNKMKDYILLGVMSAINIILLMTVGIVTNLLGPIVHLLTGSALTGLMNGVIFLLLVRKTNVKWLYTTVYLITLLVFQLIGMGYLPWAITTLTCAVLADLISWRNRSENIKLLAVAHGVSVVGLNGGNIVPILLFANKFKDDFVSRGIDPTYMDQMINFLKGPMSLGVLLIGFVAGVIGIYIGEKITKKHFVKAGLA